MWVRESSLGLADLIRLNVTRLKQFDVHKLFSHNDQAKRLKWLKEEFIRSMYGKAVFVYVC